MADKDLECMRKKKTGGKKKPVLRIVGDYEPPKKAATPKKAPVAKKVLADASGTKLNYAEAKKIKAEYGRGSYFQWSMSGDMIPLYLWQKSRGKLTKSGKINSFELPDREESQKFNKSSITKYRKVFESRHADSGRMKTEAQWKNLWDDFEVEIRKELIPSK